MKKIYLSQGKYASVDDEDFEWLSSFRWYARKDRKNYRAVRNPNIFMHKEILKKHGLYDSKMLVDHINQDTLDNQKINLRLANYSQNNINRNKQKNNKSGFKGVYLKARTKDRYIAMIGYKNKNIYLGIYNTAIAAALSYDKAARNYFGAFAATNF